VAVFGRAWIDLSKENSRLSEQILALGGALISEFAMELLQRRRISNPQPDFERHVGRGAGVEAAEYSGTRITARCALEQNRDVFAVPGNVTNKNSWGLTR